MKRVKLINCVSVNKKSHKVVDLFETADELLQKFPGASRVEAETYLKRSNCVGFIEDTYGSWVQVYKNEIEDDENREEIKSILDELLHKLIELREKIEGGEDKDEILDWAELRKINSGICFYINIRYDMYIYQNGVLLFGNKGFLGGHNNLDVILGNCDLTPLNLRIEWLQNVTDSQIETIANCSFK